MPDDSEIEDSFWDSLRRDRTIMIRVTGLEGDEPRPMTALIDGDANSGPLWIFSATDASLVHACTTANTAVEAVFVSKRHALWATFGGHLSISNDRAMIEKMWNPYVAAWYEDGKDDPKLVLMKLEPTDAKIWLDETTFMTGMKLALGMDPKQSYGDKVAEVTLR